MNRAQADVVDGARGPEDNLMPLDPKPNFDAPAPPDLPEGTVEYHRAASGRRLHLADGVKLRDPDSGLDYSRPGIDLGFRLNVARTADPEIIHRIEGCAKGCTLHPKGIPKHRGYGVGQVVWR